MTLVSRTRWLFIVGALILTGVLWSITQAQSRREIIKFSHKRHIQDIGVECESCHPKAAQSTSSKELLLPKMEQCSACHDVEDEKKCLTCHTSEEKLLPFETPVRTFRFNHALHLEKTQLQCLSCHKGIDKVDLGDGTKIPPRETCNVCHNGTLVSQDCDLCHMEKVQVLPLNHTSDWSHEHMVQLRAGAEKDCAHCHQNYECQECHEAVDLVTSNLVPAEYFASFRVNQSSNTPLALARVHDLNYRYWHALEAEGKQEQCVVCHESNQTCVECHTERSAAGSFLHRPAWHGGADWGAIRGGVGTGGGRHAELAERDIERCAACHDVQGADPTCLMCHTDFDGVKGTDPKTHGEGFADKFGEESPFHTDNGAVCFNCHVRREAGEGFCGYCHGKKD